MQSIAILVGLPPYMVDVFHVIYKLARESKNNKCIGLTFEKYINHYKWRDVKKTNFLEAFNFSY